MIHLTLQQLSAFLDCELTDASTELIRRHLSECDACTLRFARIEAQEEVMVRILVDEPGEEFFAELSESIARDIGGGKTSHSAGRAAAKKSKSAERKPEVSKPAPAPKPAPERPPQPPPPRAQEPARTVIFRAEPESKPSPISLPAPVPPPPPARTAPPMAPSAETRPALYGRRDDDAIRGASGAGRATSAWIAAAVICILVGSAAWIGLRGGGSTPPEAPRPATEPPSAPVEPAMPESPSAATPAPADPAPEPQPIEVAPTVAEVASPEASPTPAPSEEPRVAPRKVAVVAPEKPRPKPPAPNPERLVERPPQNLVPVRTIITETPINPPDLEPDVPKAAPAPPAQTAPAAARLFQDAKGASLRAAKSKDPAAFDAAASAWERVIPALNNSPEDFAMARRELAQARYQAWAESPTPARRVTAITATRAYLLYAPPGPERDQAWTWLGRLKH